MRSTCLTLIVASSLLSVSASRAQRFYLHNNDRLTFYGDSITAQRFYTRDVQDFVQTRYPDLQVTYHNAGVPGDKVSGGYAGDAAERVARDVKPWDPTVITVMLGMNDGDYMAPDPKVFAEYQSGYEKLLGMLREAASDARITLLANTPYDEITHGTEFAGYMRTTEQNAHATPALGQREHLPVVDTYTPMVQFLQHARVANPSFASLLVTDRIHPAEPTHWIIAESLMKAWHIDPIVSDVSLSAAAQAPTKSLRTQVSGLSGGSNHLVWNQLDEALPLPFNFDNELMNFVLSVSDLFSWDQELLKVSGLEKGTYSLTIDKMNVGKFSSAQLASGINLGTMKTPMWNQAREYDGELDERSKLENAALVVTADTSIEDKAAGSKILREGEAEFEQKALTNLHILTHNYTLKLVGQTDGPRS